MKSCWCYDWIIVIIRGATGICNIKRFDDSIQGGIWFLRKFRLARTNDAQRFLEKIIHLIRLSILVCGCAAGRFQFKNNNHIVNNNTNNNIQQVNVSYNSQQRLPHCIHFTGTILSSYYYFCRLHTIIIYNIISSRKINYYHESFDWKEKKRKKK